MKIQWRMIWRSKHQVSNQIEENSVFWKKSDVPVCQTEQSGFRPVYNAIVYFVRPSPAKPDSPISKTRGSEIFRTSDTSSEIMMADPDDWRTHLVHYLENPGSIVDRKVQRQALKYVILDSTLYR
jgi:hypothetical protein